MLANRIERAGLPSPETQWPVVQGRQFRFDFAWPAARVAVEVQGGIWTNGAHSRGSGVARDCVKLSMAAAVGWRCLPVTREMIESGEAVELIRQALEPATPTRNGEDVEPSANPMENDTAIRYTDT